MPEPILRGHPLRAALAGTVPMLVAGALPQQIAWADGLGEPDGLGERLRLLTVSPTLLYTDRTGWTAQLVEAVWAGVFLGVLLAAAWALAVRVAGAWSRPVVVGIALPVLAPMAALVALVVTNVGPLALDPVGRGWNLHRVLLDAQGAAGHAVLVALAGAVMVVLTQGERLWPQGADGQPAATLQHALVLLRGPMDTLWRRIGLAVLAAGAGLLAMRVLPALMSRAFEPVARLWCDGGQNAPSCASQLSDTVGTDVPDLSMLLLDSSRSGFGELYATQGFLLVFAVVFFQLRAQSFLWPHPLTTLLAAWHAYTWAAVMYVYVVDVVIDVRGESSLQLLGLLLPPSGLEHAMLSAPAVAVVFAAVHAVAVRLRPAGVSGYRDSSQAGRPPTP